MKHQELSNDRFQETMSNQWRIPTVQNIQKMQRFSNRSIIILIKMQLNNQMIMNKKYKLKMLLKEFILRKEKIILKNLEL
jgi:hypothetical protein